MGAEYGSGGEVVDDTEFIVEYEKQLNGEIPKGKIAHVKRAPVSEE